jgi:hypothetical protein
VSGDKGISGETAMKGLWDQPVSAESAEKVRAFWRERYAPYEDMTRAFEDSQPSKLFEEHGAELGVSWGVFRALGIEVALAEFNEEGRRP